MILIFLSLFFSYRILLQGKQIYFLYYLVSLFAIYSLPSEIGEYFVLRVGENMISARDMFLLTMFGYFATNKRAQRHIRKHWKAAFLLLLIVVINLGNLIYSWASYGVQTSFIRSELFSTLFLLVLLIELDVLNRRSSRNGFGLLLNIFSVVTLVSAVLIVIYPDLNQINSELYSAIGWTVETGSIAYITVVAGDICLLSIFYFLFVLRRSFIHPSVVLPVALIVAGSHRITYLTLGILFLIWFSQGILEGLNSRFRKSTLTSLSLAAIVLIIGLGIGIQTDYFVQAVSPFFERLLTLGDPNNLTIVERSYQYSYFFTDYLGASDFGKLMFGENYLPIELRDEFYLTVNPHNFIIGTIVAKGIIGFLLAIALFFMVGVRSMPLRTHPFMIPTLLFMITQMTDAAFSEFPFNALFALLLALTLSNITNADAHKSEILDGRSTTA